MQNFPIEYYTAKLTRYHPLLQWIEFRGGRHWLRMSEGSCGFTMGFASETFDVLYGDIQVRDRVGRLLEADIEILAHAPRGFPNFEGLPESKKAILAVNVDLNDAPLEHYPIHIHAPTDGNTLTHIFTIEPSMLYPDFLFDALQNYGTALAPKFPYFVETGALYGHTALHAAHYFERAFTIELSDELYGFIKPAEKVLPNLSVNHGNSKDVLPTLLPQLDGPCVFFLDAHWSGDNSTDWEASSFSGYPSETAHGGSSAAPSPEEQKPILHEFAQIFERFMHPALLIIDDWNIVGVKGAQAFDKFDWSHISQESLKAYFDASPRTVFHTPLGETRYVVGLNAL